MSTIILWIAHAPRKFPGFHSFKISSGSSGWYGMSASALSMKPYQFDWVTHEKPNETLHVVNPKFEKIFWLPPWHCNKYAKLSKTDTFYLFKVYVCYVVPYKYFFHPVHILSNLVCHQAAKVHFSNQDATNALHCQLTPQTPLIARRLHEPTIPGYQRLCRPRAAATRRWCETCVSFERCSKLG